jgi:hypothetical protein
MTRGALKMPMHNLQGFCHWPLEVLYFKARLGNAIEGVLGKAVGYEGALFSLFSSQHSTGQTNGQGSIRRGIGIQKLVKTCMLCS